MTNDEMSHNEFSNSMVESVENLIVKAEPYLPKGDKINKENIILWKNFTRKYFQLSPKYFLAENDIYNGLSPNLKVRVVKKNLLLEFQ